jgi:hypothetical protein
MWQKTHEIFWNNWKSQCFLFRYVDNRFMLIPEFLCEKPQIKLLTDLDFYHHPVELEKVGDNFIFGFEVDLLQKTVTSKMPAALWQFRNPHSAGSTKLNLSGLLSRVCIIRRQTYPLKNANTAVETLANKYIKLGFERKDVSKASGLDQAVLMASRSS